MRRFLCLAALAAAAAAAFAADTTLPLRRLALYIGSNDGGPGRVTLRYAEEDARAMAGVMQELGGVSGEDSLVLLAPTAQDVLQGFGQARQRARAVRAGSRRVELLVYYSGHSDEQGLLLGGERFDYPQLKTAIQEVGADVNIAILDSCSSGAFTRLKGGTRQPPFLLDESSSMRGHAYISSSSADEAAQESDLIKASFFTHFLISGLRGAADSTRDGQVSLNEAYHFAFNETLALTESTQGGAQHPSYNIQLTGTGDLTLTDLRSAACVLNFAEGVQGRLFVRSAASGRLVAELTKDSSLAAGLGLPEGPYRVSLEQDGRLYEASVSLRPGRPQTLGPRQFAAVPRQPTVTRGDAEEQSSFPEDTLDPEQGFWQRAEKWFERDAEGGGSGPAPLQPEVPAEPGRMPEPDSGRQAEPQVSQVPFAASLLPGLSSAGPGLHVHTLSVNLLAGSSWAIHGAELGVGVNLTEAEVRGAQLAGVGNIVGGEVAGYQGAGVFNIASGGARAGQAAGVFNILAGPLAGVQAAGVFNLLAGPAAGAQLAGVFNSADSVAGAQVGLVNVASGEVRGAQVGLVNVASGEVRGTQVGLVNVARSMRGLPVGLVSISEEGGISGSGWVTEGGCGYAGLQMASGLFYTVLYGGAQLAASPQYFAAGVGLGLQVPVGRFTVETDLGVQHVFEGEPREWGSGFSNGYSPVFPTLRLLAEVNIFRSLGLFAGVMLNGHVPGGTLQTPLHAGTPLVLDFPRGSLELYPRLLAGLRF